MPATYTYIQEINKWRESGTGRNFKKIAESCPENFHKEVSSSFLNERENDVIILFDYFTFKTLYLEHTPGRF